MTFGFREPYQILGMQIIFCGWFGSITTDSLLLVDAEMVHDASRFKMDLAASLERTVHGKAKPSKCSLQLGVQADE